MSIKNTTYSPRPLTNEPNASWMEKVLSRIFVREDIPTRTDNQVLYLRRFHLVSEKAFPRLAKLFKWGRLYLHCFYRSDEDPDPHDHPWDFHSLVLKGGYTDETWGYVGDAKVPQIIATPVRTAGCIAFRKAEHLHRARLLDESKRTWTLVFSGKRRRDWFFHTPEGPIYWETFLLSRRGNTTGWKPTA